MSVSCECREYCQVQVTATGQSLIQRSHRMMVNHAGTKLNHVPSEAIPKRRILSRVNEDRPLHDEQLFQT